MAHRARVGVGTVYHHFVDKRALLLELLREFEGRPLLSEPESRGGALGIALQEEDVRTAVVALCRVSADLRRKRPSLYPIGIYVGRRDPEVAACCERLEAGHRARLEWDIAAGQASGKVRRQLDPAAAAFVLQGLLRIAVAQIAEGSPAEADARVEVLADVICSYLLVR